MILKVWNKKHWKTGYKPKENRKLNQNFKNLKKKKCPTNKISKKKQK